MDSNVEIFDYIVSGSYNDPEAVKSSDEGDGGIPDYVYTSIAVGVLIFIAVVATIIIYCRSKRRVGVDTGKQKAKKRTTREILIEVNTASSKEKVKGPKIKRKETRYHPEPNPPGPNTKVINVNEQGPHPPPGQTDTNDVPPLLSTKEKLPEKNIAPASTGTDDPRPGQDLNGTGTQAPGPNVPPASTEAPNTNTYDPDVDVFMGQGIPPPFPYKTPAEARALGMHV